MSALVKSTLTVTSRRGLALALGVGLGLAGCKKTTPQPSLAKRDGRAPTAGQLCDHTRELAVMDHAAALDETKWEAIRPGCIADFEKKRERFGEPVYLAFLACGLATSSLSEMKSCHAEAEAAATRRGPSGLED